MTNQKKLKKSAQGLICRCIGETPKTYRPFIIKILKQKEAPLVERKVACKMLLQSIFAKEFGEELQHFCSQPPAPYEWTQLPKRIQNFRERYTNPPGIEIELEDYLVYEQQQTAHQHALGTAPQGQKQPNKQREVQSHKRQIAYGKARLLSEMLKLKPKYKVLSKSAVLAGGDDSSQQLPQLLQLRRKEWERVGDFQQEEQFSQQCRMIGSASRQTTGQLFVVHPKYLVLRNVQLQPELYLYMLLHGVHYESIRKVHLLRTNLSQQQLCVCLEMLQKLSLHLQSVCLQGIELTQRITELLVSLLANSQLKQLSLDSCGITTKLFCKLCLGIGQSTSLEALQLPNNQIDARALKSINIVVRYVQQLKYLDLSGNKLTQLDEKTIKLLNQNKKFVLVGNSTILKS